MNDLKKRSVDPSIGVRVMKVRIHRQITQQQLAAALKTTAGTIQHYEHGRRNVQTSLLKQIAVALECEVADLLAMPDAPIAPRKDKTTLRTVAHDCWDNIVGADTPRFITNYDLFFLFKLTNETDKAP